MRLSNVKRNAVWLGFILAATLAPLAQGQVLLSTGFESTDGYSAGPLTGQHGWAGSSVPVVENSSAFDGSQAISFPATGLSGQVSVTSPHLTTSSPVVTVEVHFMQSSSGTASIWAPLVLFGTGGFLAQVVIQSNGNATLGLAGSAVGNVAVSRGSWNDYQMVIDSNANTVTAYVNSQMIGSGPLSSTGALNLVELQLNDSPGTDTGYFDQLFVTAGGKVAGTYYTTTTPNCPNSEGVADVDNDSGQKIGSACYVTGTFVWFAAGGPPNNPWKSSIRVAAPDTGAIKAEYQFFDTNGNNLPLDVVLGDGTHLNHLSDLNFILNPNQPLEVDLLGANSDAPGYNHTQTGSVSAHFFCPDDVTCSNVGAQLVYSALPAIPWSLSVPLGSISMSDTTYSAQGTDDGGTHRVSFVIYNNGNTDTAFDVYVYDSGGNLFATGATPTIPGHNSVTHQGGTYGALLSQVIPDGLPQGLFKVVFDGGAGGEHSHVEVLQFDGPSATNLQVYAETAPGSVATGDAAPRQKGSRNAAPRALPAGVAQSH